MRYIFLLFLMPLLLASVDFSFSQSFSAENKITCNSLDITDDKRYIAYATYLHEFYVYSNYGGDMFTIHQKIINRDAKGIISVDLTADGEWLVASDLNGILFTYQRMNKKYELFQVLPENKKEKLLGGRISDDKWIVGFFKEKAQIYYFNGSKFVFQESFTILKGEINNVEISRDHQFLVIGSNHQEFLIFKYNGSTFQLMQTITFNIDGDQRESYFTYDHEILAILTYGKSTINFYKYDGEKYSPLKNNATILFEPRLPSSVSFSRNNELLVISGHLQMIVYSGLNEDNIQVEQELSGNLQQVISQDAKTIVTGSTGYNIMSVIYENRGQKNFLIE